MQGGISTEEYFHIQNPSLKQIGNSVVWPAVHSCAFEIAKICSQGEVVMDYIERHYKNIPYTVSRILDRDKLTWIVKRLSGNDTGMLAVISLESMFQPIL